VNAFSILPPAAFASALFDASQFAVLGELDDEGDAEMIAEVVSQFLEDVKHCLSDLEEDIRVGNLDEVCVATHSLKGNFATFGMMRAHALAREIEKAAEQGRGDNLIYYFREMLGCFMAGQRALLAHMGERRQYAGMYRP
jgi:HPt (histidine-containing phosphotransfer) domain-containing protein